VQDGTAVARAAAFHGGPADSVVGGSAVPGPTASAWDVGGGGGWRDCDTSAPRAAGGHGGSGLRVWTGQSIWTLRIIREPGRGTPSHQLPTWDDGLPYRPQEWRTRAVSWSRTPPARL